MKTPSITTLLSFALLPGALADFNIFWERSGGNGISANIKAYKLMPNGVSCDDAWNKYKIWPPQTDLSGASGVRCKSEPNNGPCVGADPAGGITEMEIRINSDDAWHWTFYKDRAGALVDVNGNEVGRCEPISVPERDCSSSSDLGQLFLKPLMRCITARTAQEIEDITG